VSKRTIIFHTVEDAQRAHTLASVFDPVTVVVAEIRPSLAVLHLSDAMERVVLWSASAAPHLQTITRLSDAERLYLCLVDDTPVPPPLSPAHQIRTGSMDGGVDATLIRNALGPREDRVLGTGVGSHVEAARAPTKVGWGIFAALGVVLAAVAGAALWLSRQSASAPVQDPVVVAPVSSSADPLPAASAPISEPAGTDGVSLDGSLALRDRLPATEARETPTIGAPASTPALSTPPLEQASEGEP
jgi:hypothetical protein